MNCLHHLNLLRPLEVLQTAFGVISQKTKKWECASPSTQRVGTDGAPDTAMDQTRPLSSAKFLVSKAGEHLHRVENTEFYFIQFFFVKSSLEINATSTKLDHSASCFLKWQKILRFFNTETLLFKCLFAPVILKVAHSFAKEGCLH